MSETDNQIDPRKDNLIYSRVNPISSELREKLNTAFSDVVTRFKNKHLS